MDPTVEKEGTINDKNTSKSNKDLIVHHVVTSAAPLTSSPVYLGCRTSEIKLSLQSHLPSSRDSSRVSLHQILAVKQSPRFPPSVFPKPRKPLNITRTGQVIGPPTLSSGSGSLQQTILPSTSAVATPQPISHLVNLVCIPSIVLQSSRNLPSSEDGSKFSLHPLVEQASGVPPYVAPKPSHPLKITKVPPPVAPKPCQKLKNTTTGQVNGLPPLSSGSGPIPQPLLPSTPAVATPQPISPLVNSVCIPSTVLQSSRNLPSSEDSRKSSSSRIRPPVAPKPSQPLKITKVPPSVAPKPCQKLKNTKTVQENGPPPLSIGSCPLSHPLLPSTSAVVIPSPTSLPVNSACRPSTVLQLSKNILPFSRNSSKSSLHPLVEQSSRVPPPIAPKTCQPPKITKVPPPVALKPCQKPKNTTTGQANGLPLLSIGSGPHQQLLLPSTSAFATPQPISPLENSVCIPSTVLPSSRKVPSSGDSWKSSSSRVPPPVAPKPCQPLKITKVPPSVAPKPCQKLKNTKTGQENGPPSLSIGSCPLPHPLIPSTSAVVIPSPTSLPVNSACRPSTVLQLSQNILPFSGDSSKSSLHPLVEQSSRVPPPVASKTCQPPKITKVPPPVAPKPCQKLKNTTTGQANGLPPLSSGSGPIPQPLLPSTSAVATPPPTSPSLNSVFISSTVLQSSRIPPSLGDSSKSSLLPLVEQSPGVPPSVASKPCQPPKITKVPPPVAPKPCQKLKNTKTGQANGSPPLSSGSGSLSQPLLPSTSDVATPPPSPPYVNSVCRPSTVLQLSRNLLPSSGNSSNSSLHLLDGQSSRVPPPVAPKPCQPHKITKVPPPVAPKPYQKLKNIRTGPANGPPSLSGGIGSLLKHLLLTTSADSRKSSLHPLVSQSSRVPPVDPKPRQLPKITKVQSPVASKPCQPLNITRLGQVNGPKPLSSYNCPFSQPLIPLTSAVMTTPPTLLVPENSACRPSTVLQSSRNLQISSGDSSKARLHPLFAVTQSSRVPHSVAPRPYQPPKMTKKPGQRKKAPSATMTRKVLGTSTFKNSGQKRRNNVKKTVKFKSGFDLDQVQEEKKNFLMIQLLVNNVGTEQMRKYFLKKTRVNRKNVGKFLIQEQHGSLKNIKFVPDQKRIMYKKDADITLFDITIMMKLIRYCCSEPHQDKFWKNPPKEDNSKLANLVRIHNYRNTKIAHNPGLRIRVDEFKNDWKKLTSIFMDFGVTRNEINKYSIAK